MSDFFPDITTVRPRFSTAPTGEPVGGVFLRYNDERSKSYPKHRQKGRMYTMRRITMTGRLTRDPELKELTSKTDESKKLKRLTFGVANNDNGKDKDPEFFDAVAWDQLAVWVPLVPVITRSFGEFSMWRCTMGHTLSGKGTVRLALTVLPCGI